MERVKLLVFLITKYYYPRQNTGNKRFDEAVQDGVDEC